jgi:hypothetical protein
MGQHWDAPDTVDALPSREEGMIVLCRHASVHLVLLFKTLGFCDVSSVQAEGTKSSAVQPRTLREV